MIAALLAHYREIVIEHASVADAPIQAWLGIAVRRHNAAAFGDVYYDAMVYYAAHGVQLQPGSGAPGAPSSSNAQGPLISQRDGDLSRTYAAPASSSSGGGGPGTDAWLLLTTYGQLYLDMRDSRAETSPFVVF